MVALRSCIGFWPTMVRSLAVYMGCVGLLKLALR